MLYSYKALCILYVNMKNKFSIHDLVGAYIKGHDLLPEKSTVILGLSGGPDSMFLLHFLAILHHQGIISLIAAHLDHQWRTNSHLDVAFCQSAAQSLQIPFVTQSIADLTCSIAYNGSQEEVGRKYRRFFLETLCSMYNAHLVALGHHADDQQETFFIRLLRGASLTGLVGMRPKSGVYIRPLLCICKEKILAYLHENNIKYLIDATNSDNNFLRNRLRNSVLPILKEADPRCVTTFSKTIEQLHVTETFLERYTQKTYQEIINQRDNHYMLSLQQFRLVDDAIKYRIIIQWLHDYKVMFPVSDGFLTEIITFLMQKQGGTHQIHQDWAIRKKSNYAYLMIKKNKRLS